jgi:hypothetical protein
MITMRQFLEFEAIQHGSLRHNDFPDEGPFYPPGNRTDWDRSSPEEYLTLMEYLRNSTYTPPWDHTKCFSIFPSSVKDSVVPPFLDALEEIYEKGNSNINFPLPVNGSLHDRLHEIIARRQQLCVYHEGMQREHVIHFTSDPKKIRLLAQFYTFVFFEDWRLDLWMKRFMRDHGAYV